MLGEAAPLDLQESDFEPIEQFSLLWRWTGETHAQFPDEVLAEIRPLSQARADAVNDLLEDRLLVEPFVLDRSQFQDVARCKADVLEDDAAVRAWFASLPVSPASASVVSWDASTAVVAPFRIVTSYWDDFFYPSSDDVWVVPPSLTWALAWWHYEEFEFGLLRPASTLA